MTDITKATFNLPRLELDNLKELARRRSVSVTQALRQAIASEIFIQRLADQGATLLVRERDGAMQELVFTQTHATSAASSEREAAHA